jgi:DNA-binding CsgD family transcriptional regulator
MSQSKPDKISNVIALNACEMLNRSRPNADMCTSRAAPDEGPRWLTRFAIGDRVFELVLLDTRKGVRSDVSDNPELTRFKLCGRTLAVIEDQNPNSVGVEQDVLARLTERELQIAIMVAQGNGTKNIARKLRISEWTVATHLRRTFAKLGVDSRAAMVYRCSGLIKSAAELARPLAGR